MAAAQCPHCERRINYTDSRAGSVVACPGCDGVLTLPPVPPNFAITEPEEEESDSRRAAPEPRYYGTLSFLAMTLIVTSTAAFLVFFAAGVSFVLAFKDQLPFGIAVALFVYFLLAAIVTMVLVAMGSLMLLLVDMGRNLAQVRENTRRLRR